MRSIQNPAVQCRNHIRTVFPVDGSDSLYVCSTGSYSPQEFYLNASTLDVVSVAQPHSGRAKCPYDPTAVYAFIYSVAGNPHDLSAMYAAVATDRSGHVGLIRPAIQSPGGDALVNLLRTDTDQKWINTMEPAYVVAMFDIDRYIYVFFRELAVESTAFCDKTYYSRVARVCKNDEGGSGLNMQYRFTSFIKTRLVCAHRATSANIAVHFNDIRDVHYNASLKLFYALFVANSGENWGSAVCVYSLASINLVLDGGSWVEQRRLESAWLRVPDDDVPTPRPAQCVGNSKDYVTSALSFIKSHQLMFDVVRPHNSQPVFYSKNLSFSHIAVDFANSDTVVNLYRKDGAELHRVVIWSDSGGHNRHHTVSVWRPFSHIDDNSGAINVHNMQFHTVKQRKWLYLTSDRAVIQLDPEQCASYSDCTHCVVDPYCVWHTTSATCRHVHNARDRAVVSSADELHICTSLCQRRRYVHTAVVPGMALYLNCTAGAACRHSSAGVADVTWMYSHSGNTSSWRPVSLLTDDNYVGSRDGGLVILRVNSSQHSGTFYCTDSSDQRVIVEHVVTTSDCQYGDDVRSIWLTEYVRWCQAFADYNSRYKKWTCMQDRRLSSECTANISDCD